MTEQEKKDFIFKQDISLLYDMAKYCAPVCLGFLIYSLLEDKLEVREYAIYVAMLLAFLVLVGCRARHLKNSYKCTPEKKDSGEKNT